MPQIGATTTIKFTYIGLDDQQNLIIQPEPENILIQADEDGQLTLHHWDVSEVEWTNPALPTEFGTQITADVPLSPVTGATLYNAWLIRVQSTSQTESAVWRLVSSNPGYKGRNFWYDNEIKNWELKK